MLNVKTETAACPTRSGTKINNKAQSPKSHKRFLISAAPLKGGNARISNSKATFRYNPPILQNRENNHTKIQRIKWASARLMFIVYIGFAVFSLIGGFLSAPLMSLLFFGDWRFWRHWSKGWRMLPHGWGLFWMMLRGEGQFMFSVPLTSPPQTAPDQGLVSISSTWRHGTSCGSCRQCCTVLTLNCPVLDTATGRCSGYDSFYWRYFNCGRYPSRQIEIDYYGCDKWQLRSSNYQRRPEGIYSIASATDETLKDMVN